MPCSSYRRNLPVLVGVLALCVMRPAAAQNLIGVSIPINSMDGDCMPVRDNVWSVSPLNVNLGIGYLVNPTSTPTFAMHDHHYDSPHVPDSTRAVVTYTFDSPATVNGIKFEQHANGITQIEGFAGPDVNTLTSIGSIFGPSGDIEGSLVFSDHQVQTFTFPNPQPGKVFQFIIRKTSLENGWACFHAFPQFSAGGGGFITSVTVTPSVVLGSKTATGSVTLSSAAPAGGATVALGKGGLPSATVPAVLKIPAGTTSKTFPIKTAAVATTETGTIEAAYHGSATSAPLTVRAMGLTSLLLSPATVSGPATSTGTVRLEAVVPASLGSVTVALSSSNPSAAAPASATLTFLTGEQTKTFNINALTVAAKTTVNITASVNGSVLTKTLTVNKPIGVATLTLSPAVIVGPNTATGTVKLDAPVPVALGSITVNLSSDASVATPGAATLTFNVGEQFKSFSITTMDVSVPVMAKITASTATSSVTKTLTVK